MFGIIFRYMLEGLKYMVEMQTKVHFPLYVGGSEIHGQNAY